MGGRRIQELFISHIKFKIIHSGKDVKLVVRYSYLNFKREVGAGDIKMESICIYVIFKAEEMYEIALYPPQQ